MTNAELIAKIKAEIERRMKILREDEVVRKNCTSDFLEGMIYGYEEVLSFLGTLESEHLADARKTSPNDLKEAAVKYADEPYYAYPPEFLEFVKEEIRDAFIAGAKGQKEQDEKELSEKIAAAYQLGLADKEKQMMSKAVEGRVFMSFAPGHNQMVMADVDLPTNTNVRVIVLPKEDSHE